MTAKENNRHKYSDANRQPRQKASDRKAKALGRQDAYNELTLEQKIAALPPEPYSKKQRARLLALLEKQSKPKEAPAAQAVAEDTTPKQEQPKPRKYMKGQK